MVAAIVVGMIACESEHNFGVTRVATTPGGVAAETRVGGPADLFAIYESIDGGLTWRVVSLGYGSRTFDWSYSRAVTPDGESRVEGTDIVRVSNSHRVTETVYSGEYLRGHIYQWVQANESYWRGRKELSLLPSSIAYDQSSGNLMAPMGIRGILVGTPDGTWKPMAVGPYSPADFSRLGRVRTLFSLPEFWGTALMLPLSMIALSMLTTRLRQEWPFGPVFTLVSLGSLSLCIIVSAMWLMALASASTGELFVSVFAFLSAVPLSGAIGCAWQKRWLRHWRAILLSFLSMMAFVTLPFVVWLQAGGLSGFAALAAIILCTATSWALGRILIRNGPSWNATWSRN